MRYLCSFNEFIHPENPEDEKEEKIFLKVPLQIIAFGTLGKTEQVRCGCALVHVQEMVENSGVRIHSTKHREKLSWDHDWGTLSQLIVWTAESEEIIV